MSHDRPTPAERAAHAAHDPRNCRVCCDERHGDQALSAEEIEIDRLRAENAALKTALDIAKAILARGGSQ